MPNLPHLSAGEFRRRITSLSPEPLSEESLRALHTHYDELRRWAPQVALIGEGTAEEVLERHFGEALAALRWIPEAAGALVDVGSGAGFPGLVLAAARPGWQVTLVEGRQRKWAFLMSVCRKAALSCRCLDARVGDPLPEGVPEAIDLVTARAIRLPAGDLALLLDRLTPAGRALFWAGEADPELPAGWGARTLARLPGSEHRRIVEVRRHHDTDRP
jgi:16S rRNA (guanine527-N7)-methyltransferase